MHGCDAMIYYNRKCVLEVRFEAFGPRDLFKEVLRHFFSDATMDEVLASCFQRAKLTGCKVA